MGDLMNDFILLAILLYLLYEKWAETSPEAREKMFFDLGRGTHWIGERGRQFIGWMNK